MVSTKFLTQNMIGNNCFINGYSMNLSNGFGSCNNMIGNIFNYGNSYYGNAGAIIGYTFANVLLNGVASCFAGKVGAKSSEASDENSQVEDDSNLSAKEQLDKIEDKIADELTKIGKNEEDYNDYDITNEDNYKNLKNVLNKNTSAVNDLIIAGKNLEGTLVAQQTVLKEAEAEANNNAEQIASSKRAIAETQVAIENNKKDLEKAKEAESQAKKDLDEYVEKRTDEVKTAQKNIKKLIQKRNTLKIKVEKEDNDAALKDLRKTAAEFVRAKDAKDNNEMRRLAQHLKSLDVEGISTSKGDDKYLQVRESAIQWLLKKDSEA